MDYRILMIAFLLLLIVLYTVLLIRENKLKRKEYNENSDFNNTKQITNSVMKKELEDSSNKNEIIDGELTLDVEQKSACSLMENTKDNYFITGKAGTGKSFLLRYFVDKTKKRVLKVSPTGISALNIGGDTIHSIFGYRNIADMNEEDINKNNIELNDKKRLILKEVDTIIIDEISMVRADVFDKIEKILRIVNNNDLMFGGKQLLVFGDLFQLPPIAGREEEKYLRTKYGGIYFFQSYAYRYGNFQFIDLQINHRQKDDMVFFEILNRIREGSVTDDDIITINERVITDEFETQKILRLFPTKGDVDYINKTELEKLPFQEYCYDAQIVFNKNKVQNIAIEKDFPIVSKLKLKEGSLVMMVRNDEKKRWVNGTFATVSKLYHNMIKVVIDGIEYEIFRETFEAREAVYKTGKIFYETVLEVSQYPLVLAYAITIHKSQGMTYKNVACDVSRCFAPGQAYVALSRCSRLDGLKLLNKITKTEIKVDEAIKNFYLTEKSIGLK